MLYKIATLVVCSLVSFTALAHQFNPLRLDIIEHTTGEYRVIWWAPINDLQTRTAPIFPADCQVKPDITTEKSGYSIAESALVCASSIKGKTIKIDGDIILDDVLVTIAYADQSSFEGMVSVSSKQLVLPADNSVGLFNYLGLGIKHFLTGLDHILFIFGLFFIVVGTGNIIKTITAFTLAHSITLALSVFEIVKLGQASIEIIIALTIVYLALEIANNKQYNGTPWGIAFGFGLLHGFGFANVLNEIGLQGEQLFFSLLLFNLGIELGQLAILPIIAVVVWLVPKVLSKIVQLNIAPDKLSSYAVSYLLGTIGCYWVIDRSISMFI